MALQMQLPTKSSLVAKALHFLPHTEIGSSPTIHHKQRAEANWCKYKRRIMFLSTPPVDKRPRRPFLSPRLRDSGSFTDRLELPAPSESPEPIENRSSVDTRRPAEAERLFRAITAGAGAAGEVYGRASALAGVGRLPRRASL